MIRETVDTDTPAAFATSFMLAKLQYLLVNPIQCNQLHLVYYEALAHELSNTFAAETALVKYIEKNFILDFKYTDYIKYASNLNAFKML